MLARISLLVLATVLIAGCTAISTGVQHLIIRPFISDPKPLYQAAQSGASEELIADGVNVNATAWTPLHLAARDGHLAVGKLLVAHGAKVNTKDRAGDRPLDLATDHRDVSNFLRQHGGITKTESNNLK